MAKTRRSPRNSALRSVTLDRAARFYRLLRMLANAPKTREQICRKLRLDVRGFYRDLESLRAAGIPLTFKDHRYRLELDVRLALFLLPFPDPGLTLGEARLLAKGRSPAHRKLKDYLVKIVH